MASATGHGKPELSTLLESGTFYFALTLVIISAGKRESWIDSRMPEIRSVCPFVDVVGAAD
jgi:hypothetical protein